MISPGQAHERLAIIERRHQVIRRSLDLFLLESEDYTPEGVINALNYVIPQVNRMPNVQGYSPLQWTLGYNPHIPGLLMEEELNPTQLHPTEAFKIKLNYQQIATKSIAQANNDDRLRRALLRRYSGMKHTFQTGDLCYYWRDAVNNQRPGPKICWKGPATIVMIEQEPHEVLWIAHGTTLLRASPEHVKPVLPRDRDTTSITVGQPWKELSFHFNKFAIVESLSMSIFPSPTRELEKRLTLRMRSTTPTTNFLLNLAVSDVIPGVSPPMDRLGRESIGSQELTSTSQFPPTKLQFTSSRPPEQQML